MNIVIAIQHPAWAHQFQGIIKQLRCEGHNVLTLAIRKEMNITLLEYYGITYTLIARSTGRGIIEKAWLLLYTSIRYYLKARKHKADLFIGRATPNIAIAARLLGKPSLVFEDTGHAIVGLFFCRLFATKIMTNKTFKRYLGKKHTYVDSYKELFYLHPDHFTPDSSVLALAGLAPNEPFFILRFVAWEADHDFGHKGLSIETKRKAVEELGKLGKVFISSEKELPQEFERFRMPLAPEKMHHLLYFATLVFGESTTMAAEAAVLWTHAVLCHISRMGYVDELENIYQLISTVILSSGPQEQSVLKAVALAREPGIREIGKEKRKRLLAEKRNGARLFLEEIRRFF